MRATELTLSDWRYLMTACCELFVARLLLKFTPIGGILSSVQAPSALLENPSRLMSPRINVQRVAWALAVVARRVPWKSDCLIQSVAAKNWLRRHHLNADFYLGAAKDDTGEFLAHAWLRCGDVAVVGGRHEDFSVIIGPLDEED